MPTLTIYDKDDNSINVQLPDDTVNYGDMDPKSWGGLFTDFGETMVSCVVTESPHELPADYCDGDHLVTRKCGYYDDMLDHNGTQTVATGFLKREVDASGRYDNVVQAAIGGALPGMIAWATDRQSIRNEHFVTDDEYAETMVTNYNVPEGCL